MKASFKVWNDKRIYVTLEGVSSYQAKKGLFVDITTGKANTNLRYNIGFKNEEEIAKIEREAIDFYKSTN